jgi:DNA-binding CsgD family transcriptional regulator
MESVHMREDLIVARNEDQQLSRLVERFGKSSSLSPRQTELVRHAVKGIHRKESASQLDCRLKTIEGYWRRIYSKTGCCSEAEVVAKFILELVEGRALAGPNEPQYDLSSPKVFRHEDQEQRFGSSAEE